MRWRRLGVLFVACWIAAPAAAEVAPPPEDQQVLMSPEQPDMPPPEEAEDDDRGVDLVLPVFRMAFGTSQSVDPGSLGGFAFDLVLGSRLAFQPLGEPQEGGDTARWRPVLSAEAGYTRRAGDYGTHDLTLGLGVGFYTMAIGAHLYETVTFGVDGGGRFGLRTTLRLETLWGLFHLDVGHEVGFADGVTTHDIRGVVGIDVGLLISVFVLTSKLH